MGLHPRGLERRREGGQDAGADPTAMPLSMAGG